MASDYLDDALLPNSDSEGESDEELGHCGGNLNQGAINTDEKFINPEDNAGATKSDNDHDTKVPKTLIFYSFGFEYGCKPSVGPRRPPIGTMLRDCRRIENPSKVSRTGRTGLDKRLRDEVLNAAGAEEFWTDDVNAILQYCELRWPEAFGKKLGPNGPEDATSQEVAESENNAQSSSSSDVTKKGIPDNQQNSEENNQKEVKATGEATLSGAKEPDSQKSDEAVQQGPKGTNYIPEDAETIKSLRHGDNIHTTTNASTDETTSESQCQVINPNGPNQASFGYGCAAGKHRSVSICWKVMEVLKKKLPRGKFVLEARHLAITAQEKQGSE